MADLGVLSGIGSFGQGFLDSYRSERQYQDKQKQLNLDNALKMKQAGVIQNSQGGVDYTPEEQSVHDYKTKEAQRGLMGFDPNSELSQNKVKAAQGALDIFQPGLGAKTIQPGQSAEDIKDTFPMYEKGLSAKSTQEKSQSIADTRDQSTHNQIIQHVQNDPILKQNTQRAQNLKGALSAYLAKDATPEAFHELQQAIRANIGAGAGGVGERETGYMNSLGMNGAKWTEFLSGDTVNMDRNSPMLLQAKAQAQAELGTIDKNINDRVMQKVAGHNAFYKKHPTWKQDLVDTASGMMGDSSAAQGFLGPQSPQQGLVQQPQQPQTKVVNGKTFIKVQGGWQEQ